MSWGTLIRNLICMWYVFDKKRLLNKENARLYKLKCNKIIQGLNFWYSKSTFKVFKIQWNFMCRSKVLSKTLKISSIFCRCLNELSINFQSIQLLKFTQYPRIIDIHNNIILWQAAMHIVLFVRLFAYIFLPFCLRLTLSRIMFLTILFAIYGRQL